MAIDDLAFEHAGSYWASPITPRRFGRFQISDSPSKDTRKHRGKTIGHRQASAPADISSQRSFNSEPPSSYESDPESELSELTEFESDTEDEDTIRVWVPPPTNPNSMAPITQSMLFARMVKTGLIILRWEA